MSYKRIFTEAYNQVKDHSLKEQKIKEQDNKDHEISMARGELEAIADKALKLSSMLQGKSDEGNPLEAWVQSKITKAKDYINSVSDYMGYNPDVANEELEEGYKTVGNVKGTEFKVYKNGKLIKTFPTYIQAHDYVKQNEELEESHGPVIHKDSNGTIEKVGDKFHTYKGDKKTIHDTLDDAKSALKEETISEYTQQQIKQAYGILNDPRYKAGNYDGAVAAIEKLAKGLSKHPDVANALKRANEEVDLEEKFTVQITKKDGTTMELGRYNTAAEAQRFVDMYGSGAKVKKEGLEEATSHTVRFTDPLNKKRFAIPYKTHKAAEDKMAQLKRDGVKEIKITMDELKPGIKFAEQVEEKEEPKKEEEDSKEKLKAEIEKKDDQIQALKVKAETEKAKQAKKETERLVNPETGEPLLQVGVAYKHLRDKMKKEEVELDEAESYGLMGRMSDSQIQNIKKVWAKKTPKDVTQGVKDMIKKMDIPTQLAIKIAKINVLSDLIEETDLEEKKIKDIFQANKEGESADEIAKRLKMPISRVKSILGESHYKPNSHVMVKGKRGQIVRVDTPEVGAYYTVKMDDGQNVQCKPEDITLIEAVSQKEIDKFHTSLDNLVHKHFGHSSDEKKMKKEMFTSNQIADLQKAYASLRGAKISPEKANMLSKKLDGYDVNTLRQLMKANIPFVSTVARNKVYRKTGKFEGAKSLVETITAVKNKAEKSGMPYSILKQVYDRGMAAWKGGHRPGATQQQWALARVNSFVTKSSGTWGGADSDLAKKVKGSK